MNILNLESISKAFGTRTLFSDVTLGVDQHERIGIIGVNGSGKSTLLKIAAGIEPADSGRVTLRNDARIGYLAQDPSMDSSLTVLDYVYPSDSHAQQLLNQYAHATSALEHDPHNQRLLADVTRLSEQITHINAWEAERNAKTILSRLGIDDVEAQLGSLSGGQRKRVALARTLIDRPDLLILDEPTNHIDPDTISWLEGYLASTNSALLLITHDRYFLDRVVTRIVELDDHTLYSYPGNYEHFVAARRERELQRDKANLDYRNEVRREVAWLRQGAQARTTKQKARIDRIEALLDQDRPQAQSALELDIQAQRMGKRLIELNHVSKSIAGKTLLRDFSYELSRDDRLGIIGANGVGKSTLLNMIAGRLQPDSGDISIGETIRIAYYDQTSSNLDPNQRLIDYVSDGGEVSKTSDGTLRTAAQMLERFLFPPSQHWDIIGKLSGGERRRLYLLRTLMTKPNILLLDEPSNDLDVQTIAVLEEYLDAFPGAVIVVSHDRAFLDNVVDHMLVFEGDGMIRHVPYGYSVHRERQQRAEAQRKAESASHESAKPAQRDKPRKLSFKEQRELQNLEQTIAELEAQQNMLTDGINSAGADYQAYARLHDQLTSVQAELETAFERWMELSERATTEQGASA